MKYITLICMAGMSTSLLVSKMQKAAEQEGIEAEIIAMSESAFETYDKPTDVLLLGPQISYQYDRIASKYEPKGIKVAVIERQLYGLMDGKAVLHNALNM